MPHLSHEQQIAKEFKNHKAYVASLVGTSTSQFPNFQDRKGKQITWSQYNTLVERDILRRSKRIITRLTQLGRP